MARNREPNFRGDEDVPFREIPSAIDSEQALLGAIMTQNDVIDRLPSALNESHFHEQLNGAIFRVMQDLRAAGKNLSPITIKTNMPDAPQKIGDLTFSQYLARLASEAVGASTAGDSAFAVLDASERRTLLSGAEYLAAAAYKSDEDMVETTKAVIDGLNGVLAERSGDIDRERPGDAYLKRFTASSRNNGIRGVPMFLPEMETVLSEPMFEAQNLYGILASSGGGKTSFVLQQIYKAASEGHPTLFLSYDQTPGQCVSQMVAQQLGISMIQQRDPEKHLSEKQQNKCLDFASDLNRMPFDIIKCNREGVGQLITYARRFVKKHRGSKTPLIIVDHVGKIVPKDSRADAGKIAGEITVELKAFAGESDCVVIALNQRNSSGMMRDNPRPIARDIFGNEGARQDYDALLWVYRPDVFRDERIKVSDGKDLDKINRIFGTEESSRGVAEIGTLKVRFGPANIVERVKFDGPLTRYISQKDEQEEIW